MRRRSFLAGLVSVLAVALAAEAQQPTKLYRIGYLAPGPTSCPPTPPIKGFKAGLIERGYTEGQTVVVDRRCFPTPELARETLAAILATRPDVLLAAGEAAVLAMKGLNALPIVFVDLPDPVGSHFVQTLARPGTHMTGVASSIGLDLDMKRLELLKEAVPTLRRIATLTGRSADQSTTAFQSQTTRAATMLGIDLRHLTVGTATELPSMFDSMLKQGVQGLFLGQQGGWLAWTHRARIIDLAARHRLPTLCYASAFVDAGAFMSYGADQFTLYKRAAYFVDKVLKGAKPADLPVEQPTKFELAINLKTAKALGLTIPPSLLLRADHIIE